MLRCEALEQGVVHRGAKADLQRGIDLGLRALQVGESCEEMAGVALAGVDDAAVEQGALAGVERPGIGREGGFGLAEAVFVEGVFQQFDAVGVLRVAVAVICDGAGRGEEGAAGLADGAVVELGVVAAGDRVGRVVVLRHGVAEVGDPGQAAARLERCADAVCGGDGVSGPQCLRLQAADDGQAGGDGAQPPAEPAVGARERGRVAAADGEVARGVPRLGANDVQGGR